MTQPSLFQSKAPRVRADQVSRLVTYLTGRGWVKRAQVTQALGLSIRHVRALAEASRGEVIGTDRGYHVTFTASVEDCDAWDARFAGQIATMTQRRADVRRVRNRRRGTVAA